MVCSDNVCICSTFTWNESLIEPTDSYCSFVSWRHQPDWVSGCFMSNIGFLSSSGSILQTTSNNCLFTLTVFISYLTFDMPLSLYIYIYIMFIFIRSCCGSGVRLTSTWVSRPHSSRQLLFSGALRVSRSRWELLLGCHGRVETSKHWCEQQMLP